MIRPATRNDIARLIEIRGAVRENRLSDPASIGAADYQPYVEDGRCWLWESEGVTMGFAALDTEAASVWALFVAPEAEGRGIGRALLGALVANARASALPALTLTTAAASRARDFYAAAGWRIAGHDARGDVRMRLTL